MSDTTQYPVATQPAITFSSAISICFTKYFDFTGRATRSEFWWFYLFINITFIFLVIFLNFFAHLIPSFEAQLVLLFITNIVSLVLLFPFLAVGARRLHDTNRSGWWLLLYLIPLVGWIVLMVFFVLKSEPKPIDPVAATDNSTNNSTNNSTDNSTNNSTLQSLNYYCAALFICRH